MPPSERVQQFPDWPDNFARFDADYLQAIPEEIDRLGCARVFLVVSGTLHRETDSIARLEAAIGEKFVGKKVGVGAHTPYADVLELVDQLHKTRADIVVTVGGSSYSDAAKIALIVHASLSPTELTVPAMEALHAPFSADGQSRLSPAIRPPTLKLLFTPTTLSAAEYHTPAAATHPVTRKKTVFFHPQCAAHCVVLDPALCTSTPAGVWRTSGMRAVDHCVEGLCTPRGAGAVAALSEEGLRLLVPALLAPPEDTAARARCQRGAWRAVACAHYGVALGASHAIGHQLGSVAGVAHGATSCVLLPAVLKYNAPENGALQARVVDILWDVAGDAFAAHGLQRGVADAGDMVRALVAMLGLPGTLAAVGVTEEAVLDQVAAHTLTDIWGKTNPRSLETKEQVREILAMAA